MLFTTYIWLCLGVSGVLPPFLQEKVPAMMGCEAGVLSPTHDELEELDVNSGVKKRHRCSFGGKTVPSMVYLFGKKLQYAKYIYRILKWPKIFRLEWCSHTGF